MLLMFFPSHVNVIFGIKSVTKCIATWAELRISLCNLRIDIKNYHFQEQPP